MEKNLPVALEKAAHVSRVLYAFAEIPLKISFRVANEQIFVGKRNNKIWERFFEEHTLSYVSGRILKKWVE